MNSLCSGTSTLPHPRPIPGFTIDRETLEHLKQTSPLHYLVAVACLNDGRWKLKENYAMTLEGPQCH